MNDGTITLDMSKAQPVTPPPTAPDGAGGSITLDLSKGKPVAAPEEGGVGGWLDRNVANPDLSGVPGPFDMGAVRSRATQFGVGAVKSGATGLGNALNDYFNPEPSNLGFIPPPLARNKLQDAVHQHVATAVNWLTAGQPTGFWQKMGALGETLGEIITADNALKLAGPVHEGMDALQHMKQGEQVLQTIKANSSLKAIVGIGLKHIMDSLPAAPQEAVKMAGQTLIHTNDPKQAAMAGATAGVMTPASAAVSPLISAAGATARAILDKFGPETVDIAEQEGIPVAAQQVSKEGEILPTGAADAPEAARKQQEAFNAHLQNTSRVAATNSIGGIVEAQGQPVSFRVAGAANPAEAIPTNLEPEYFKLGDGPQPAWVQRMARKEPATAGETAEGVQTTDPHEAAQWQNNYENFIGSPTFKELSEAEQVRILKDSDQLKHQLGMHYSQSGGLMDPIDMDSILSKITSPGDAAAQIKAVNGKGWAEIDRLSNGEVNNLEEQARAAQRTIWNPDASAEAKQAARETRDKAQSSINDLLTSHAGDTQVTTAYYKAMKQGHADASFLSNLNDEIESMTNGVTRDNTAKGKLVRVVTGNTKGLENFLADGQNRKNLTRLMGPEAEENLKTFTQLLSNPGTTRKTSTAAATILREMTTQVGGVTGLGWLLGFPTGHGTSGAAVAGHIALATYGTRKLLTLGAANPTVGKLIEYAVKNNVDAQIYAPLIARTILAPFQKQKEQQGQDNTQPQQ